MVEYVNRPVKGLLAYGTEYNINGAYYKSPPPSLTTAFYETKQGSPVINWKGKVKDQQDASSAYFRQWAKYDAPGYFDFTVNQIGKPQNWSRCYGYYGSASFPWSGNYAYDESVTRDIALTKIKRKIASDQGDFAAMTNLFQDVYEFRRTIHGTMDSILNLGQNVLSLFSRHWKPGKAGFLRNAADLYLEWTFGINPTIKDVQELGESIQKYLDRKDHTKRFQATHYSDASNSQVTNISPALGMKLVVTEVFSRRYICKYTSGHNMTLLAGNNYGLSDHFHLAPTDFIPMAWEMLPWSWVWDYMFNVGDYLEDVFQSSLDYSFYNVSSISDKRYLKADIQLVPNSGWEIQNYSCFPRAVSYGKFTRTPLTRLPGRILRLRTEYEMGMNATNKIMNLLAVLATKQFR